MFKSIKIILLPRFCIECPLPVVNGTGTPEVKDKANFNLCKC